MQWRIYFISLTFLQSFLQNTIDVSITNPYSILEVRIHDQLLYLYLKTSILSILNAQRIIHDVQSETPKVNKHLHCWTARLTCTTPRYHLLWGWAELSADIAQFALRVPTSATDGVKSSLFTLERRYTIYLSTARSTRYL